MFGSRFPINWVEEFHPHTGNKRLGRGSREVSPLGSNVFIQGGYKRHRVQECPPGVLSRDLARALGKAVRRYDNSTSGWVKVHIRGFIKVDMET